MKFGLISRRGCFGGWWGPWDALVRYYRPGSAPDPPTDGNIRSETFAQVVQRHARDDAARDDGGAFRTHPDNVFSAFELAHDAFVGVDASDAAAISARLNALDTTKVGAVDAEDAVSPLAGSTEYSAPDGEEEVLISKITAWRLPSGNFKTGGDWVRFFVVGLSNLDCKEPSVFENDRFFAISLATLNAKSVT